jgi:CheY-like chemotaxis protein
MAAIRLLVVEDDQDGQEVVGRLLRFHRLDYDVVGSAEDALTLMAQKSYTGAIIDLALPQMDGWSLLETIRTNPNTAHMKCVAVTAYHSAEVAVKAIEHGFKAYFAKPLEATSFVREVQRVVS